MTDHGVTDLLYGHLGQASYDTEEQIWSFSRETALDGSISPLQPLEECIPPSLQDFPGSSKRPSKALYKPNKWLLANAPEVLSANALLSSMRRTSSTTESGLYQSTLMAIGQAVDIWHTSGSRTFAVMAMAHGEAGNILRLIKPRVEALGWGGYQQTKVRVLNPTSGEECYWIGDGGPINRVCFASDSDGPTSWMAVQKAQSTTILRPIYRQSQTPSAVPSDQRGKYPSSCLDANPIFTLKIERTGSRSHVDVSFNPWYIRQFAIIDQQGYWSVWNLHGHKRGRTAFDAVPGNSGHICDDILSGREPQQEEGDWGRVIWAGSAGTLVVCSRQHLAVFDLKNAPKRLPSPELVGSSSNTWMLDMKRSPINLHQIFVLTTSHIFWVQITAAGEGEDEYGQGGAKTLLSCRHFRDQDDETAQLELIGENDDCIVILYSSRSPVVSTYRFCMSTCRSPAPICSQGFFVLSADCYKHDKPSSMIQTLCLLPTTYMLHNLKPVSGPAKEYANHNIRFYQLFNLGRTLGISHVLCGTRRLTSHKSSAQSIGYQIVLAPTFRDKRASKIKSSKIIEDDFIIPDGLEDDELSFNPITAALTDYNKFGGDWRTLLDEKTLSINARRLFEISFLGSDFEKPKGGVHADMPETMAQYLRNINLGIQARRSHGQQGVVTFLDLASFSSFSEDIDEAAASLAAFVESLAQEENNDGGLVVTALAVQPSPFTIQSTDGHKDDDSQGLSATYDKLVDVWISCLPRNIPGMARLARERAVRSICTELYFSSLIATIRDKSVIPPGPTRSQQGVDFVLPVRAKSGSTGPLDGNKNQTTFSPPVPGLPTPATRPSIPPTKKSQSLEAPPEDEAISRLRVYAISVKTQRPLGVTRSALLAHWPSTPGADPNQYSWEPGQSAATEEEDMDSDEEDAHILKREEDRRRRRTENFLKRQNSVDVTTAASQPMPILTSGSQLDLPRHILSSQSLDVPMTQPQRGIFGSRLGQKTSKKRRTKGF